MTEPIPTPGTPLTPEEEAELRGAVDRFGVPGHAEVRRLLATLDAERAKWTWVHGTPHEHGPDGEYRPLRRERRERVDPDPDGELAELLRRLDTENAGPTMRWAAAVIRNLVRRERVDPDLRAAATKLVHAIDAKDDPNVWGWSREVRAILAATEVPREPHRTYERVSGDVFRCLDCGAEGRITAAPPHWDAATPDHTEGGEER